MKILLKQQTEPFLYPEYDWEKRGFVGNTTVATQAGSPVAWSAMADVSRLHFIAWVGATRAS
jgi:hypothetical protein